MSWRSEVVIKEIIFFVKRESVVEVFEGGLKFGTRSLFAACLTLLFGCIRVILVSESDVLFLLVEIWYSLLVELVPSPVESSFVFPSYLLFDYFPGSCAYCEW